jgi:uncharacterized damage-inducible protein DinB
VNKQNLMQMWDHIRQVNGVGLRVIEAVPENKLDTQLIPGMKTPKELAVHMYAMVLRGVVEGALNGEIKEIDEKAIVAGIRTRADLLAYCTECWNAADRAANAMTDEKLMATVKTPWGMSFTGFVCFGVTHDEYLHHRGQMYAYVRAAGVEPPMLWGFEQNAPAYRPKATATA